MVRSRQFLEIIEADGLADSVTQRGNALIAGLRGLAAERGGISNVRGIGSLIAFTLESPEARDAMMARLGERKLMALTSGEQSIRFRLPLVITAAEIDTALERVADSMPARV